MERLKDRYPGFRMTKQKKIVLEEVRKVSSHPTAYDVYKMARKRLPKISMGTVYRNLEVLSKFGLIQKIEMGNAQTRFDANTKKHYHVRCIHCGRVDDVPVETTSAVEDTVSKTSNYEILGHSMEFYGLCPDCKKGVGILPERPENNPLKIKRG